MTNLIGRLGCKHYQDLAAFALKSPDVFWKTVWEDAQIIGRMDVDTILTKPDRVKEAVFFEKSTLNFTENLLRRRDGATAIYSIDETGAETQLSYNDLYNRVVKTAIHLKRIGVKPGERVVGYMPNIPETIIASLATAAIGAVWTACSPDFGVQGVLDRFTQISPKVFMTATQYPYNGKIVDILDKVPAILAGLPTVEHVFVTGLDVGGYASFETLYSADQEAVDAFAFEQFPFNTPLYIMFSSGTTGIPKCIVHGAGGTLIEHLKEHCYHCDIGENDIVFYYTTCSWMMWHWLVSVLASKASIVLYEGSPMYPNDDVLFNMADRLGVTLFGTSAKYLGSLQKNHVDIQSRYKLPKLRTITSTGSPLASETFDYIYSSIKSDVHLASISGGTDIIGCFILGNPIMPVYRGELQCATLGYAVDVADEDGKPLTAGKGELVCRQPFPSRPLGFWNDENGEKYHNAYYAMFGNTWHHGDFIEKTSNGGYIIHGRSDAILNPGGVRIGTAEIYRQVELVDEVVESLTIGQNYDNDVRVILFVVLKPGLVLDDALVSKIKRQIRDNTTPRHVPAMVLHVSGIPKTKNGKIAELAVRNIIHKIPVKNTESLANPDCLTEYELLRSTLEK